MSCTTILVGRAASNDGSTMIARTDDGHFDVKKMIVVEPKKQPRKYRDYGGVTFSASPVPSSCYNRYGGGAVCHFLCLRFCFW